MMLLDKINYEFKCFFLDLMRTSKENIFAHSAEIETKKKLLLHLQSMVENMEVTNYNRNMPQSTRFLSVYRPFQ